MNDRNILYEYAHMFKPESYSDSNLATGVRKNLDRLAAIHERALQTIAKIQRNNGLTAIGKQDEFRMLAAQADEDLKGLLNVDAGYADQIARLEKEVAPQRHRPDDIVWAMECIEVRNHLRSLDPVEAESFFLAAMERVDAKVMEAVQYSPIPFRFASKEMIAKIAANRSAAQFPEETQRLDDLRHAQGEVTSARKSVEAALGKQGVVLGRPTLSDSQAA